MLILTRRMGERLLIGDEIKISVLGKKGKQIRIGIEAPREVQVYRQEIYDRIKQRSVCETTADEAPAKEAVVDEVAVGGTAKG